MPLSFSHFVLCTRSEKIMNGECCKSLFYYANTERKKEREKVGKDEKYIINQSDSLILILLVFLDGI